MTAGRRMALWRIANHVENSAAAMIHPGRM